MGVTWLCCRKSYQIIFPNFTSHSCNIIKFIQHSLFSQYNIHYLQQGLRAFRKAIVWHSILFFSPYFGKTTSVWNMWIDSKKVDNATGVIWEVLIEGLLLLFSWLPLKSIVNDCIQTAHSNWYPLINQWGNYKVCRRRVFNSQKVGFWWCITLNRNSAVTIKSTAFTPHYVYIYITVCPQDQ